MKNQGKSRKKAKGWKARARDRTAFFASFPCPASLPFFTSRSLLLPCSVPLIPFRGTPFPSSFLYPLLPFMSSPFSIVPLPFITFLPSFFVFVFCLSFLYFSLYSAPASRPDGFKFPTFLYISALFYEKNPHQSSLF